MARILATIRELKLRGNQVRQVLEPLAKSKGRLKWKPRSSSDTFVIGAYSGKAPSGPYRTWRFVTKVSGYTANYFEEWEKDGVNAEGVEVWEIQKAYLNIYRYERGRNSETEVICLHCDPYISSTAPYSENKRGPHIHVVDANHPLPKAHIALCRNDLSSVLSSVNDLTSALKMGIQMIDDEVMSRLSHQV